MAYPKFIYPPAGFQCDYQHCCPHMNGISTKAVFGTYQRYNQDYGRLWHIIDSLNEQQRRAQTRIRELERENALLQAKYQALHHKQFKAATPTKRSAAPVVPADEDLSHCADVPQKRRRGAPAGHPGWFRPRPRAFDRCVETPPPTCCPHCLEEGLPSDGDVVEHWQEDIVLTPRTVTTLYRQATAFCPRCKKRVVAAAHEQSAAGRIGPTAKSTAMYLHHGIGLSYRKTQRVMEELFGMKYAVASALNFDEQTTQKGTALYEDLREKIRATDYIHADETHWRQNGKNGYVWFAGNPDLAFFHIADSRSGQVAAHILGDNYGGVLVADGYQGYNAVNPKDRQSCLAHLIRKCDDIVTEIKNLSNGSDHHDALDFCTHMRELLSHACVLARQENMPVRTQQQNYQLETLLWAQLEQRCQAPLAHPTAETFRKRLIGKEKDNWFTFLRHPGVPPTNNHAEQSIRHMVIMRKTSFGTRSKRGSERHGILQSLAQTAKRQGKDMRAFFTVLLTKDTACAQRYLYRNETVP